MKRIAGGALVFISLLVASREAGAWESICRDPSAFGPALTDKNLESSICAPVSQKECDPGIRFARGVQLGEHTLLTRDAMRLAGLDAYINDVSLISYYANQGPVPTSAGLPSIAPADVSRMATLVQRPLTIPELAQIADGSYGLSDYLLGDEHCLTDAFPRDGSAGGGGPAAWRDLPDPVKECHRFSTHMGAVNSTHFVPQAKSAYALYHGLARKTAARCKAEWTAIASMKQAPFFAELHASVKACVKESLAFEAVGSHYLGDAWAVGHMWERWGSPVFAPDAAGRLRAQTTSLFAGIIHGWRSVSRPYLDGTPLSFLQHDQLSMPGPFDPSDKEEPIVEWTQNGKVSAGGGDLYLLGCNAYNGNASWAVHNGGALTSQLTKGSACLGAGFSQVYADGPGSDPAFGDPPPVSLVDPSVDPLGDSCWSQRATNRAMKLGAGVSSWRINDPGIITRVLFKVLPDLGSILTSVADATGKLETPTAFVDATADAARIVSAIHSMQRDRAARNPNGTESADLSIAVFQSFLGIDRNSGYASLIDQDKVPYLELHDPAAWSTKPVSDTECAGDRDCPEATYCDPTVRVVNTDDTTSVGRRCVRHEAAILRAFRTGEMPYWCSADDFDAMDDLRSQCAAAGSATSDACTACVEVVLPHLRNACDARTYVATAADGTDHRSACDVMADAGDAVFPKGGGVNGNAVYATFDATSATARSGAALKACQAGERLPRDKSCGHLAAGYAHVCHANCDGTAVCWGDNATGEIGKGALSAKYDDEQAPVAVVGLDTITSMAAGSFFTCATLADGTARCWGGGCNGQLGAGGPLDGTGCGINTKPLVVVGLKDAVQIVAGGQHTCARTSHGTVWCWGSAHAGQVGSFKDTSVPARVASDQRSPADDGPPLRDVTYLAAKDEATCAVRHDGTVWCWGNTLGVSGSSQLDVPSPVTGISHAIAIFGGVDKQFCARLEDGTLSCFGLNLSGQFGSNNTTTFSVATTTLGYPKAVEGGFGYTFGCFRHTSGTVSCAGSNLQGRLGYGGADDTLTPPNTHTTPVTVTGLPDATEVIVAGSSACATRASGAIVCWGDSQRGQIGDPAVVTSGKIVNAPHPVAYVPPVCK